MITEQMITEAINILKNKTLKKYININVVGINNNLSLTTSKLGGLPYIPLEANAPTNSEGNPLALLAQINLAELPENNIFPTNKGLLQFWIDRDDLIGLNMDNSTEQDGFRIIYYKDFNTTLTNEDILQKYTPLNEDDIDEYSPFNKKNISLEISFNNSEQSINSINENFESEFLGVFNNLYPENKINNLYEELPNELYNHLYESFSHSSHAIGGYPFFTQWDPRPEDNSYSTLLLQIDSEWGSDKDYEIMWGDSGVANFFISEENLKNMDFSDVIYNWDCY